MAEEIIHNDKTFILIPDQDIKFNIYIDNNPDQCLEFQHQHFYIKIYSSLFPTEHYGYGIDSNLGINEKTHCTFQREFDSHHTARLAAYRYIKDNYLFCHGRFTYWGDMIQLINRHFEPKSLFDL